MTAVTVRFQVFFSVRGDPGLDDFTLLHSDSASASRGEYLMSWGQGESLSVPFKVVALN